MSPRSKRTPSSSNAITTDHLRSFGVLRNREFALLSVAGVVSRFGDRVTGLAIAYLAWDTTGSGPMTVLAVAAVTLPYATIGFFGGAIADSIGHRRAMIAADVARAVAIGAIPLVVWFGAPLAVAFSLVFAASVCSTVFNPARLAVIPDVVSPDQLDASNSFTQVADRLVEIGGTVIAGLLVALLREVAFYIDALSFIASAMLLSAMRTPMRAGGRVTSSHMLADAAGGLVVIWQMSALRANTVFSLLAQLSLPLVNALIPVLILREYGRDAGELGLANAAIAGGAMAAGLVLPGVIRGRRKGRVLVSGFGGFGAVLVLIGLSPSIELTVPLLAVLGAANVIFLVPNVTLVQQMVPAVARARVFAARSSLVQLSWIPGLTMAAGLADLANTRTLIIAAGLFTLGVAGAGYLIRAVRNV